MEYYQYRHAWFLPFLHSLYQNYHQFMNIISQLFLKLIPFFISTATIEILGISYYQPFPQYLKNHLAHCLLVYNAFNPSSIKYEMLLQVKIWLSLLYFCFVFAFVLLFALKIRSLYIAHTSLELAIFWP
jgi:hypothetical protein